MWAIIKKEFKSYFTSPIGWIYIGTFLLSYSLFFYIYVFTMQTNALTNAVSLSFFILTITVPILTMKSYAEERKQGTEQLLLTSPRGISDIVWGKFFATGLVIIIASVATISYYFILKKFGTPELGVTIIQIIGMILLSFCYISIGMFASSLSENQIISVLISLGIFILMWILPNIVTRFEIFSPMYAFLDSFYQGTISIANLILLLSTTIMFNLFTTIVLQRRKNVK